MVSVLVWASTADSDVDIVGFHRTPLRTGSSDDKRGQDPMKKTWGLAAALPVALIGLAAAPAMAANGNGVVTNDRYEAVLAEFNLCNGEQVTVQGTIHYLVVATGQGGSRVSIQGHLTGEGDQGDHYVLNTWEHDTFANGAPLTSVRHTLLVSTGPAPNQLITVHYTFQPFSYSFSMDCTG